jgi:hypothetical protein
MYICLCLSMCVCVCVAFIYDCCVCFIEFIANKCVWVCVCSTIQPAATPYAIYIKESSRVISTMYIYIYTIGCDD